MAELVDTGGRSLMSQEATTRGQFNMAPASWELRSTEFTSGFVGEASPFNSHKMWSLPNVPNSHIIETSSKGSTWNTYKIIVDGQEIVSNAKSIDEAKKAAQVAVLDAQNMADARAYAEKVIKDEAAREARDIALNNATAEAARKKVEKERTKAEAPYLRRHRLNRLNGRNKQRHRLRLMPRLLLKSPGNRLALIRRKPSTKPTSKDCSIKKQRTRLVLTSRTKPLNRNELMPIERR
jgi:hypothetical protein